MWNMTDLSQRPAGKQNRQKQIVADLKLYPAIRVNELAERLGVSTETIRRDLADLDERGLINRTYGGAMRPVAYEPGISERESLLIDERQKIAGLAAGQVEANDILMIGGGATTLHFARRVALLDLPITVITHSFSIAMALAASPLIRVLMLPGQYDGREGLIHGADTVEQLQKFRANKAYLGASGLTVEGPNDAAMGPGLIYGAMMRRSAHTFVLADHSKFDRPSLTVYGPWSETVTLVSDAGPEGELLEALGEAGVKVMIP
jgi:DeoR/GlpR family transcriptional regulator of sugar metabolism